MNLFFNSIKEINLTDSNHKTVPIKEVLDEFLAKGWYRMNNYLFTIHCMFFENMVSSVLWLRLPLRYFKKTKSLRQIYNRVYSKFRVEIRKATYSKSQEGLYQKYVIDLKQRSGSFASYVGNRFETYEVNVYDGDLLIAFSYFDLGKDSIASILGVFHPNYKKYSLGIFTMLAEVEYGVQNQFDFYYPGYVVLKNPIFDYKLRLKPMEFYHPPVQSWIPWDSFDSSHDLIDILSRKIRLLAKKLREEQISFSIRQQTDYNHNTEDWLNFGPLLDHPFFITLPYYEALDYFTAIVFHPYRLEYAICKGRHPLLLDIGSLFLEGELETQDENPLDFNSYELLEILAVRPTAIEVVSYLRNHQLLPK